MPNIKTVSTHGGAALGGLAAGLGLAAQLIQPFEGERTHAYLDPVGIPTVCYGETDGVELGQVYTHGKCLAMLNSDVKARTAEMQRCLKVPVSPATSAAMISFGYNLGVRRFCDSIAPLANSGHTLAACNRMELYVYAGGRKLPGLVTRRNAEAELCREGLQ